MTIPTHQPRRDPTTPREFHDRSGALRVIDIRTPGEFETARAPGSDNVPLPLRQERSVEVGGHLDQDIVLVWRSGMRAAQAEQTLAHTGVPNVHLSEGAISAWQQHAAPLTHGRHRSEIDRQVRLVPGTLVLLTCMGGLLLAGPQRAAAVVGAGLAIAALANARVMGVLLVRVRYDRGGSCGLDTVVARLRTGCSS
jgi:rhodanese-related sulfurtransferase